MDYRPLGGTGLNVSAICLGAMMFGWRTRQNDANDIVAAACQAGVNLIDTSNSYGNGWSERVVGKALRGSRDRWIVSTKFRLAMDVEDSSAPGAGRSHIIAQCEASLQRLGTDWIDLYLVHFPDSAIPMAETLRALDDLIRSGKVRHIGTSSFAAWQIVEGLSISKDQGLHRFSCEQAPYNMLERRAEREVFPVAQMSGIGILTWSPLAEGILSGKYSERQPFPEGSRFAAVTKPGSYGKRLKPEVMEVAWVVQERAAAKGCTPTQLAIAWILSQRAVSGVLVGPSSLDQLVDNLGALTVEISDQDHAAIDAVSPPGGFLSAYYNDDHALRPRPQ